MNAKQWGAMRKLPSGRVQASYVGPDGVRYPAPQTFSDDPKKPGRKAVTGREKAEAWLRQQRAAIEAGAWVSPTALAERAEAERVKAKSEKFGTYAATWIKQRVNSKGQPLRPKTRAEYERQLKAGLAMFANDSIDQITPARVREWHSERMELGATQAGAEARLLHAIMNTAVVDEIVESNPVPGALTRSSTGKAYRPPTMEELSIMLSTVGSRFRLAVLLAAYGNIRLSEWRALRRRDVMIVDGRVLVSVFRQAQYIPGRGWVVGPPKSEEGERVVPLPSSLTAEVEAHLAKHVGAFPDSLLFPPVGPSEFLHDRQWNAAWNVARDAAGVRVPILDGEGQPTGKHVAVVREHDLRAFALTTFSQAGGTVRETQKFGGHATVDAAMKYQHAAQDRIMEIVDKMPLPPAAQSKITAHKRT